jgi:hypothetical protein
MVKFSGTAPANPAIDMSEEAACKAKHTGAITDPEIVVATMLANAYIYVKSGSRGATYPAPTTPVVIDQDGCLYHPRVWRHGRPADEIRNSDLRPQHQGGAHGQSRLQHQPADSGHEDHPHLHHRGNHGPAGGNVQWLDERLWESRPIRSSPRPARMAAYIKGPPAGDHERKPGTRSWHPDDDATVTENGTATADFTFGPKA